MSIAFPIPRGTRQVVPDYLSDGVSTSFPYPFYLVDPNDLYVGYCLPGETVFTRLTFNVDYTVSGVGVAGGGDVLLDAAYPANTLIRVKGLRVPNRLTNVVNDGALQPVAFEQELDTIEFTMQEMRRDIDAVTTATGGASGRVAVADENYAMLPTDRMVGLVTLTASRTITLPAASSVQPGPQNAVFVCDETGNCGAATEIVMQRAGADTIGGNVNIALANAWGGILFISNGKNLWLPK